MFSTVLTLPFYIQARQTVCISCNSSYLVVFAVSIDKKDGLGYTFDNGAKAAIGGDGLGYKFGAGKKLTVDPVNQEVKYKSNNGAEVYGKRKDDGKPQLVWLMNICW